MYTFDPTIALLTAIAIIAIGIYKKLWMEASIALFLAPMLWRTVEPIPLGTLAAVATFPPTDSLTAWIIQWLSLPTGSQLYAYGLLMFAVAIVFATMWALQMQSGGHWIQKILEKRESSALSQK